MRSLFLPRPLEEIKKDKVFLEKHGIKVIALPLIAFKRLKFKLPPLEDFRYLYFGSKRAVKFFFEKVAYHEKISHLKILTVGQSTAQFLKENYSLEATVIGKGSSDSIVEILKNFPRGKILVPTAKRHSGGLETLKDYGFSIEILPIYQTVYLKYPFWKIYFSVKKADYLLFTSPSTFMALMENLSDFLPILLKGKRIISIGKTTANFINKRGFEVNYILPKARISSLVEIINKK
jgi:uroporphyrinogen-III synthase